MAGGDAGRTRQDAPIIGLALKVPGHGVQPLLGLSQPIQGLGMNDQGPRPRIAVHHLPGNLQRRFELAGIEVNPAQNPILRIIRGPGPGLSGQFQAAWSPRAADSCAPWYKEWVDRQKS